MMKLLSGQGGNITSLTDWMWRISNEKTPLSGGKHQVDEREVPSLKPQQILHFIEGIGLDGVLLTGHPFVKHRKGHKRSSEDFDPPIAFIQICPKFSTC
jgi:hypothetical protein